MNPRGSEPEPAARPSLAPRCIVFLVTLAFTAAGAAEIRPFSVAQLEALGRDLYEIERRTDIAIELLNEYYAQDEMGASAWVTEGEPEHLLVRFIRFTRGRAEPVLDAQFDGLLLPSLSEPADKTLSSFQKSQLAARVAVQPHLTAPCSPQYESVVLEDPETAGMLLYALAVPSERTEVMLGGHHRFSVSADGEDVSHTDALSTSCARARLAELQASNGVKGVAVRANLSDTPLEIHVYLSLRHHIPLYVVTRDLKMWEVRDGRMRVIRQQPGEMSSADSELRQPPSYLWVRNPGSRTSNVVRPSGGTVNGVVTSSRCLQLSMF